MNLMKMMNMKMMNFSLTGKFDTLSQFKSYIHNTEFKLIKSSKKRYYYNIPCTIDIESSSFIENGEKRSCMYAFTIGINGHSYLGRTYQELISLLDYVSEELGTITNQTHIIFYVHNLSYEFQFFRGWFKWNKVFAISNREPLYAIMEDNGVELRCSYHLSGYSLAKVGEHLQKYHVEKKIGDLDYKLIRHSKTPLTARERGYILNDGEVVMAYIQEQIESHHNNITYLPLTKTGEVRKYVRTRCLYGNKNHKRGGSKYTDYHRFMIGSSIQSVHEYKQLKRAFMGGFTHANALYVNCNVSNVTSYDFTSSYPYVMVSEKFPYGRCERIHINNHEELEKNLKKYCCIFDITFINIQSIFPYENYISSSKCTSVGKTTRNNGRIVFSEQLSTTITNVDFNIIKRTYKWDKIIIRNFRRYKKDYLPKDFILSVLDLYNTKTKLKDVTGYEKEYMWSKEQLNSCYGMMVTDICRDEINYENGNWNINHDVDHEELINKYNNQKNRFLCYQWGIFVTAYARRNLWYGILSCGIDYCYSDTDSIKIINAEKHIDFINKYNLFVQKKLKKVSDYYHIDYSLFHPKTNNGVEKIIGVFDNDGFYEKFKTLGAKRYMVYSNGILSFTISGVNKKYGIPYLKYKYNDVDTIFDKFDDELYFPSTYDNGKIGTGKNTHTYVDEEIKGTVIDYLGNVGKYHEYSFIHMEESDYSLSINQEFMDYLFSVQEKEGL